MEAHRVFSKDTITDETLVKQLAGFSSRHKIANEVELHYVVGGKGEPLILLPGWPETWWSFHKIMPRLAEKYQVIGVDLRGMGGSAKPQEGYTKKNMAKDIWALINQLGLEKVSIAGHDIGANVAFSFAANYPERTSKLIMLDTSHPDENMYKLPMLPVGGPIFPWWVAFNQVKELPEQLLEGRYHIMQDWIFDNLLMNKQAVDAFDRAVYKHAYDHKDGIRAANAWYQAFTQDIQDMKEYHKIEVPALGLGSKTGYEMFQYSLPPYITNLELQKIESTGHFLHEEKPEETAQAIIDFLN